jgi:cobalt-zinc-cadmium efflux system outer membrane protein
MVLRDQSLIRAVRTGPSRFARNGAVVGIALALAGCVSYEAKPVLPEQNAERLLVRSLNDPSLLAFVQSNLADGSAAELDGSWNLETLTLAAFYFHPELDVARAQWAVAEAARVTAGERPGAGIDVAPGANTTTSTPSPRLVTATADLTLETGGKRAYRIAQAAQLAEAARLNVASVAWQVRSRVRSSLLALYGAGESERLLGEQQTIQAQNLRILEGQFREGAISAFELTQARLASERSELALRDAQRRAAEARAQLAGAVGVPVTAINRAEFSFDAFEELPPDLATETARRQSLSERPDILSALAQYAASQSELQLAVAGQYPDIHLGPGYEYDQGDNKWSLGLSVALPADRNRGPIAQAKARREETAARFDALQSSVLEQIDLASAAYRAALQKEADVDAMLSDLTRQQQLAQQMLDAGAISGSELAALRLQLSASALDRLDALMQAQQAVGQLEDAVQSPLGLPSAVWEQPPRGPDSTGGTDTP